MHVISIQIDAQEWLDQNVPLGQRNSIHELHILPESLLNDSSHLENYRNIPNKFYIPQKTLTGTLNLQHFTP